MSLRLHRIMKGCMFLSVTASGIYFSAWPETAAADKKALDAIAPEL